MTITSVILNISHRDGEYVHNGEPTACPMDARPPHLSRHLPFALLLAIFSVPYRAQMTKPRVRPFPNEHRAARTSSGTSGVFSTGSRPLCPGLAAVILIGANHLLLCTTTRRNSYSAASRGEASRSVGGLIINYA